MSNFPVISCAQKNHEVTGFKPGWNLCLKFGDMLKLLIIGSRG